MKNLPTIIQLEDYTGEHSGLYVTDRTDVKEIQTLFDVVGQEAIELEESEGDDWDIHTYIDEKLENGFGIVRVYAETITTNIL